MTENNAPATTGNQQEMTPVKRLSSMIVSASIQQQYKNALGDNSGLFLASVLDIYSTDKYLQECQPGAVLAECLKAATLRLPINKQLGFAYIVPYKEKGVAIPQFQIGYKGLIQLAMRTGSYRVINADMVYEGELVGADKLTGTIDLSGKRTGDKIIGYFAHMETVNGFSKTVYMSADDMAKWAKKYSKSYAKPGGPWQKEPDAMGIKTCLRKLLGKYGIMSIEFAQAMASEDDDMPDDQRFDLSAGINANTGEIIDVTAAPVPDGGVQEQQQRQPGF